MTSIEKMIWREIGKPIPVVPMTIGKRIGGRLEQIGMSQAELARRVGVTQPTINALISGSSRSSTHLHRIATELRTTSSYLSGETNDPDSDFPDDVLGSEERELVELFRGLAVKDQAAIMQIARTMASCVPSSTVHSPKVAFRGATHG